ncbi:hypothetical protein TRV_02439, partial [Trichophyton verrucosum HKI 0517]
PNSKRQVWLSSSEKQSHGGQTGSPLRRICQLYLHCCAVAAAAAAANDDDDDDDDVVVEAEWMSFGHLRPSWEEKAAALRVLLMTKQSNQSLYYADSAQAKSGADQPTSNALTAFGNPLLAFFFFFEFLFFDTFFIRSNVFPSRTPTHDGHCDRVACDILRT